MKKFILITSLILSATSSFAACPDDYNGTFVKEINGMVIIQPLAGGQLDINLGAVDYSATVNASAPLAEQVRDPKTFALKTVSVGISCDKNDQLILTIDGTQHIFSKSGKDLVVDGKTYPLAQES